MPHSRDPVTIAGVALRHRVHSAFARDRLGQALHEIALDVVHPSPNLGRAERERFRAAITRPIRLATEAALGTFAAELERAIVDPTDAPPPAEGHDD